MEASELFYTLALLKVEGVGDIMAKKLMNHCGSAEAVFKTKTQQLAAIDGVGTMLLKNLKDQSVFDKANKELEFIQNNSINVSYFQNENYRTNSNIALMHRYCFLPPEISI